jgi:hypothetical protein
LQKREEKGCDRTAAMDRDASGKRIASDLLIVRFCWFSRVGQVAHNGPFAGSVCCRVSPKTQVLVDRTMKYSIMAVTGNDVASA